MSPRLSIAQAVTALRQLQPPSAAETQFAATWSDSSAAAVADALSEDGDLAERLFEDTPPAAPQWLALALRTGLTTQRELDPADDVVIWPGHAKLHTLKCEMSSLLIIGGSLFVDGALHVPDECTLVVAGDVDTQHLTLSGNLVVLGDVRAQSVKTLGNGGLLAAARVVTASFDNPHLHVSAVVQAPP